MSNFTTLYLTNPLGIPINTFKEIWQFNLFNFALWGIFILEGIIFFISHNSNNRGKNDRGSFYVVIIGFTYSIYIDIYFIRHDFIFNKIILPYYFYILGIVLMIIGIFIRAIAVATLRNNFTVEVNTSNNQDLIKSGLYKYVRNPAYLGSLLSLVGIAVSLRCLNAIFYSFIVIIVAYSYRIFIEEKALKNRFGDEFKEYCKETKRLIPFIY